MVLGMLPEVNVGRQVGSDKKSPAEQLSLRYSRDT